MRASVRAAAFQSGESPSRGLGRALASPAAFFLVLALLLCSFVYLCAVLSRVLVPDRASVGMSVFVPESASSAIALRGPGALPLASVPREDERLAAAVAGALGNRAAGASVAVINLDDGRRATHAAGRTWYAASTFKLALLYEAERRHAAGEVEYEDRLVLTEEALSEDLGTMDRVPIAPDGTVSIGEALTAMITLSDNATAVALLRHLGPAEVDATLRDLGLTAMSVNTEDLPVTVADLARLMLAIISGEGVGEEERSHMRALLLDQTIRDGIPAGLPPGVASATGNKTGTWPGMTADVAFVETSSGRYVLAVFADGDWNWPLVRDISSAVYEEMVRGR